METGDLELLEAYVRDRSESAFRQIVERYGQLVYGAAHRRLRDHQLAEDAAQATFVLLARKAHKLGRKTMLGGWLWRTATFCARNLARQRAARTAREQRVDLRDEHDKETTWEQLAPQLDEAMATLSAKTRETLVAHYLLGKPRRELAMELGVHVDTINKRVQNGIEKLRRALSRRGVAVSSVLLAGALTERAAEAATAAALHSMHAVAYGTVTGATATSHSACTLAEGVLKMMAWNRIKLTASYVAAMSAVCGLSVALATSSGLIKREYRLPEEQRYVPLEYPREVLEGRSGFILDFFPDSWATHELGGLWKIKLFRAGEGVRSDHEDPGTQAGYQKADTSTAGWDEIPVPYSISRYRFPGGNSRKLPALRGVAWYRRGFDLPSEWTDRLRNGWRVLLRFEGLQDYADVWLNGQTLGARMTGRSISQYDVTDSLLNRAENQLALRVVCGNSRAGRRHGLWQPVRLVCVPPVYSKTTLVATKIEPTSVVIKADIMNHGPATKLELTAELAGCGKNTDATRTYTVGPVELQPGLNTKTFRIKTPGARLWSPDTPALYLVSLRSKANELARERIGFREFVAKDGHFYLNGKKIKLMGFQFGGAKNIKAPKSWCCNHDNHVRKLLYGLKQANVNFARCHNGGDGGLPVTFYNLCDEMGILMYDECNRVSQRLYDPAKLAQYGKDYLAWVKHVHNHASLVLWDFGGNEIYSRDMEMIPVMNYMYALLQKADIQRRPKTSSSGRLTWKRLARSDKLEKVDFADSHAYTGYFYGSYQDFISQFQRHRAESEKKYGPIPTINCEWGWPGDTARYRGNTTQIRTLYQKDPWGPAEKRKFIEYITSKTAEIGGYMRGKANWAGGRIWTTDPLRTWERKAELAKRFLEVFRRSGETIDGGHFNTGWYDLLLWSGGGHEGLHAAIRYMGLPCPWDKDRRDFMRTPAWYVWRSAYAPQFICLDVYDKNTFAGKTWRSTVHIMNDAHEDAGPARAVLQIRDPQDRLRHQQPVWQGQARPYLHETVQVAVPLPTDWATGTYRVELFLLGARSRRLSDNGYPLNVVGRRDLRATITPKGRVGLYEVAREEEKHADQPTTAAVLNALRIPFTTHNDFAGLGDVDILIIGRNSIDVALAEAGPDITQWVARGGRLLCFEQSKAGQLPFLPDVKVISGKNATFTELMVPKHPIFTGLGQDHFDDWNEHRGLLFTSVLSPLNEGMLSIGPTTRFGQDNLKMISASYSVGKGEIVLSQYRLTDRYGKDAIATRFTQNLLLYVLTQPRSELSLPFESKATAQRRIHLKRSQAHFIDLARAANGTVPEFKDLPAGVTTLAGDVPFSILDPAKNQGRRCIELRGERRTTGPRQTPPIAVGKPLSKLYVLHCASYANRYPKGEVLYTVRVRYQDGKEQRIPFRNGIETGDWWRAKDHDAGLVVFRQGAASLFLTELDLTGRTAAVHTIAFESAGKADPTIVAATGRLAGHQSLPPSARALAPRDYGVTGRHRARQAGR